MSESVGISLFRNETTGTVVSPDRIQLDAHGGKGRPTGSARMRLLQLLDKDHILIGIPSHCCAQGHRVALTFAVPARADSRAFKLEVQGVVEAVEAGGEGLDSVRFRFVSIDRELWNDALAVFEERQSNVTALFGRMKGH